MTSAPPDSEERRGLMSHRVAEAEEKHRTGDIDPAPRGGRLAPMNSRHDEVWFGGGQAIHPSLIAGFFFKIEGVAVAA